MNNKYLLNQGLMVGGIYRAYVIKRTDYRVYIPGLMNYNIFENDGSLNEDNYEKLKETLPEALFNSKALRDILTNEPTPCWVMFENGDSKRPIVMGYLGKGVKSVPGSGSTPNGDNSFGDITDIIIDGFGDILLVAGHGNGDPGACANGYQEANLTREIVKALSSKMKCDVYDTSKNMYKDLKGSDATNYLKKYKVVMEVHFNAGGGSGSELLVKNINNPTNIEVAVLNALTSTGLSKHGNGWVDGNWLGNMSKAKTAGVQNYFLVEMCFIDSEVDMNLYTNTKSQIIDNIVAAFNNILESSKLGGSGNGFVDTNTKIMGSSVATYNQMITYLRSINKDAPDYCSLYLSEGAAEGVRGDIAFAQSCVETGHWTFTGDVTSDQNNFAGIGTTGGGVKGEYFDTPQLGIRAQIQHLKAYASTESLNKECVDPRFNYVTRGCATKIGDFGSGKWPGDTNYSSKIISIMNKILAL